ncbi:hypothetical protein LX16_3307 [Stackebrandtia albiflava]|uniref:Hemerythrin HHE cation binding domain-containing protein n=1 Tax=Stackebrandtia albiflava TaxID=406432 RepID=A0A562V3Y9_9ACTN|nr:hypothetical protein [Stackebrandtia albiflava]TWJ12548.1 hypothetical protein LX16_3307 [Stackebrandtia albiflava]
MTTTDTVQAIDRDHQTLVGLCEEVARAGGRPGPELRELRMRLRAHCAAEAVHILPYLPGAMSRHRGSELPRLLDHAIDAAGGSDFAAAWERFTEALHAHVTHRPDFTALDRRGSGRRLARRFELRRVAELQAAMSRREATA